MVKCFKCDKAICGEASLAYNLGFGPVYFCAECVPVPKDVREIIEQIERAIVPRRELPDKP